MNITLLKQELKDIKSIIEDGKNKIIINFIMLLYPKTLVLLGVTAFIVAVPPVRRRFDEKVFRHFRNWNRSLNNPNQFVTQE